MDKIQKSESILSPSIKSPDARKRVKFMVEIYVHAANLQLERPQDQQQVNLVLLWNIRGKQFSTPSAQYNFETKQVKFNHRFPSILGNFKVQADAMSYPSKMTSFGIKIEKAKDILTKFNLDIGQFANKLE